MSARNALALLGYVAAFALLTFPLLLRPGEAVISHWDADIEHSLWVQWWFAQALESPEHALFESDLVDFPQVVDLQLADLNLAVNAVGYGLGKLLPPAAAYNAALLLSFLLAAGLMQQLLRRLTADDTIAWLGGLCFAASPYWLACVLNGWCYLVHTWVLPLAFLALLRARDRPGLSGGAVLGLALATGFHVTPYYFVYVVVLLALLLPWQLAAVRAWLQERGALGCVATATVVLALGIAPRVVAMASSAANELVVHHGPLNTVLGAALVEWLWPSHAAVEARLPRLGYLVSFLGYCVPGTIAVALVRGARSRELAMWLVTAAFLLLLSLGPALKLVDGEPTALPLPGAWLQQLPVFRLTTNHWRWTLPAGFCLVVAFALALARLSSDRRAVAALVGVFALEVALVWPLPSSKPLWEVAPHPIAFLLRDRSDVHAVLDRTDRRKLNQTVHGKAIALGWLPRLDVRTQRANEAMIRACRGAPPGCLRRYGIDAVVRDAHTALLLREGGEAEILTAP